MKRVSIKELAEITGGSLEKATDGSDYFSGVSTDSRTVKAGECFFAIAGENFDGHNYLASAFEKGAVCAVVSSDFKNNANDGGLIKVEDTVKALGRLAGEHRHRAGFKVVAITGSVGKTTTRRIIYHVLKSHFRVFQSPKNFNNQIGLPLTLLGAGAENDIVVTEIGSSSPGEVSCLAKIAAPEIAVVTNVNSSHLKGFGNIRTIIEEKLSISDGLNEGGVFFINGDSKQLVEHCRSKGTSFISFGKSSRCDIQAENIMYNGLESRFTLEGKQIVLSLAGPGNVVNSVASWSVCRQLGISIDDFAEALRTLPQVSMRAEILKLGTLTVINDCYNANPASMKNALEILRHLETEKKGRKVFICGDMAELAEQTEQRHRQLGRLIAKAEVEVLLTVGKWAQLAGQVAKGIAEYDLQTKSFENAALVCNNLEKIIKDYDIILVKGSRTARLEAVSEKLKEFL
ncbi:MAG: UDP-N-acetylmuramoyl-tripeptide--D-alanyl-D-alanine ligase [Planctomycetota bacterium]|jgi:UDP-N-acetylmuramoyl-tripeptide--D-alanyl-D-alanine ligase